MLIRQAIWTCKLLFYINADDHRDNDSAWDPAYTFVTAPLVRSIIDCLYNVTRILQSPRDNGKAFRQSGLRKELEGADTDQNKYGGQPDWDEVHQEQATES